MGSEQNGEAGKLRDGQLDAKFRSGEFADCTIVCGNRSFPAHKVIVCAQCSKIATAFRSFKEGDSATYKFEEQDPCVVQALLAFLYRADYDYDDRVILHMAPMVFHVAVWALAQMYELPSLMTAAEKKFESIARQAYTDSSFFIAVRSIYGNTLKNDKGMRRIICNIAWDGKETLFQGENKKNVETMQDIDGFAADLVLRSMEMEVN